MVEAARALGVDYASDTWSPLSDITLGLLLKRAGIRWRYCQLEGMGEIVWPPVCGIYIMHVEKAQTPGEKRLAIRHGLAHVLAGDVDDLAFSHDGHAWQSREETVADLFALIDLVPWRVLSERLAVGYTLEELRWWLFCELRRYAPSWPVERIRDRVEGRLVL